MVFQNEARTDGEM